MDKDNLSGEKALIEERRKKLEQLRDKGDAYGNSFKPKNNAKDLHDDYGKYSVAINYYIKALKCNPEHFNAQNNLIRILYFYKTDQLENNSIIKAINKIQEIH